MMKKFKKALREPNFVKITSEIVEFIRRITDNANAAGVVVGYRSGWGYE
jgi:hypothetical protein